MSNSFDEHASLYDAWFMENSNVLLSEVRLVARTLAGAKKILSVGCGSGLFEKILAEDFGIKITDGIEPAAGMAEIALKRGMNVVTATAEEADFGDGKYDTILFNG
ncbi:MAG: class I SAM-dependent methyltransferase, partial [Muribaculaceae bacterium]|nr:class I SAM-dependent methyltransferase [Muribaculaceae bacterium]